MRNHLRFTLLAALLGAGSALAGCNPYYIADDIDLELDFSPVRSDELHTPYVAGTKVTLWAGGVQENDKSSVTFVSADESILQIDEQKDGDASCTALAAGTVEVEMHVGNGVVHTSQIVIKDPTRAVARPYGPLIVHRDELTLPEAESIKVLAGGTATFLVDYYADDERLNGNGVLSASGDAKIDAETRTTFLFENREWIQVTPHDVGPHPIALSAAGVPVGTLAIEGVASDDVVAVGLFDDIETDHQDESWGVVLGQAFGAGSMIYGVSYDWDVDGVIEPGEGDLYRYEYDSNQTKKLSAHFGDRSGSLDIHSSQGFVDSSNKLGCTASGRPSPASALPLAGALLAIPLMALRRRKRARRA